MWLFTRYGFFSVIAAKKQVKKSLVSVIDKTKVMVRARCEEHLLALCNEFEIPSKEILVTTDSDYRYRIILKIEKWMSIASHLADEVIQVENFKDYVKSDSPLPKEDKLDYLQSLHNVWSEMYALQPQPNRTGKDF